MTERTTPPFRADHVGSLLRPATLAPPRTIHPFAAHPIARAPFYAVPLCCGVTATMGGIAIDEHCHALHSDGTVISGLYAAGSTIAGIRLFGEIFRNDGSNCSPAAMFTGITL